MDLHCVCRENLQFFHNSIYWINSVTVSRSAVIVLMLDRNWRKKQEYISNWIIVQQDATAFCLLHICKKLYMFRVLTPIIRSSYDCNYSFWHWSTGSATISFRCRVRTAFQLNDRCTSFWWWVSTPETCRAVYVYVINWIQSHLLGNYSIWSPTRFG